MNRVKLQKMKTAGRSVSLLIAVAAATPAFASDTIIWARYGDIDTLDPHRSTSTLSMQVWNQIYEPLLARDSAGKIGPNLASSYSVEDDGLSVSFVLNPDVKCHDGSDFTSKDVLYTYERAFSESNPSNTKSAWGPIDSVTATDDLNVEFKFKTPFGAFIPFMADPFASMICDTNEALGDSFGTTAAIGTGAWVVESWIKGDKIDLSRNESYVNLGRLADNQGAAKMKGLTIKVMPEGQARLAALQTGEVHIAEPPLESVEALKADPKLDLIIADNTGQDVFFEFAISRPPLPLGATRPGRATHWRRSSMRPCTSCFAPGTPPPTGWTPPRLSSPCGLSP